MSRSLLNGLIRWAVGKGMLARLRGVVDHDQADLAILAV